jgi:hypothetical protein
VSLPGTAKGVVLRASTGGARQVAPVRARKNQPERCRARRTSKTLPLERTFLGVFSRVVGERSDADAPLNATSCAQSWLELTVFNRDAFNQWWDWNYRETKYHGVWNGSACSFELDPGYSMIWMVNNGMYDAFRAVGVAYTGAVKKRVVIGSANCYF